MQTGVVVDHNPNRTPAYFTAPDIDERSPGIVLIHEIWGLNANIREIANRLRGEGYAVIAPDLFSEFNIADQIPPDLMQQMSNPQTRNEAQKRLREILAPINVPEFAGKATARLQDCYAYLQDSDRCNGNIAVTGFCFGGSYSFALAAAQPGLKAAVPFYGQAPDEDKIKQIQCPILAFYGERDEPLMAQLLQLKETMARYGKQFEAVVYPNCGHAFFNDRNPNMYNREAAEGAWQRMLAFLDEHLVGRS